MGCKNILGFQFLICCIAFSRIQQCLSVHGHHYQRRAQQREDAAIEEELEEDLDEEDDRDDVAEQARIVDPGNGLLPSERDGLSGLFAGESLDFLRFLKRARYDHRQAPSQTEDTVTVSVSVVVSNIRAVSEITMDYSLELYFRESWVDPRLAYPRQLFRKKNELTLHESYAGFLWHPDTFMPNALSSKNPRKQSISHRTLLRLQADGRVLYSRRLSVVAECQMDLSLFPFDMQLCKLGIESYGYTADQVRYEWSHGQREALKLHRIRLPDFQITKAFVTSTLENYATGNYSRLYICFLFSRSAGFCFLQLIIPSTAVVIISWVSLWMENETSFQDMISIILTITFLLFSYNEVMPRVAYLKALDIWLAVCFMIVFLSLIKLALLKHMRQKLRSTGESSTPLRDVEAWSLSASKHTSTISTPSMLKSFNKLHGPACLADTQLRINEIRSILTHHARCRYNLARFSNSISKSMTIEDVPSTMSRAEKQWVRQCVDSPGMATPNPIISCKGQGPRLFRLMGSLKFSAQFVQRFHWITQIIFCFGFFIFSLFFFIAYPNGRLVPLDEACEKAEWFATIPI